MRKIFGKSFEELVAENKKQLLSDPDAIKKIESKLDKKHVDYSKKN
ncbi:FbpB family small basic protein [Anaerobacillus sp. CMMVII]|nr:FbpB family small basic protein [Anaerobacillus sp. CMMVII]MCT8136821.1 FbpB family small basic protein [Anaerobacillus sp. CMMVII]